MDRYRQNNENFPSNYSVYNLVRIYGQDWGIMRGYMDKFWINSNENRIIAEHGMQRIVDHGNIRVIRQREIRLITGLYTLARIYEICYNVKEFLNFNKMVRGVYVSGKLIRPAPVVEKLTQQGLNYFTKIFREYLLILHTTSIPR